MTTITSSETELVMVGFIDNNQDKTTNFTKVLESQIVVEPSSDVVTMYFPSGLY